MTSNFIPYLPSSPPPLTDEDDDDDEFGSFTIANHLCNDKSPVVREKSTTESANGDQSLPPFHNSSALNNKTEPHVNSFESEDHNKKLNVNGTNSEGDEDIPDAAKSQPTTSRCVKREEIITDAEESSISKASDSERTKETVNCNDQTDEYFNILHETSDYSTFEQNDSFTDCNDDLELPPVFLQTDADIPDLVFKSGFEQSENSVDNSDQTLNQTADVDDSTDGEWLGFTSVSHTAAADDEDDEFSDFVSQPSDDTLQKFESKSCNSTEKHTDVYFNNVISRTDSRRNSTEPFQANFEAHFDDDVDPIPSISIPAATKVVLSSFVPNSSLHEEVIESLDNYSKMNGVPEDSSTKYIWSHISDSEKTDALAFQWSNSNCNKKLMRAINIDSRNLLFGHNWNSSVPLFAANLSLNPLEPTKTSLKTNDVTEDKESIASSPQEFIPPAQFDWNSSGLINPLDASNGSSALLDLDFFFTNGSVNPVPTATWSLENELLGTDSADVDINCTERSAKVSPLLEQILSSAKLSASNFTQTKATTALSHEAQLVLNKLPDLRFMQAKVLMFPIRSATP